MNKIILATGITTLALFANSTATYSYGIKDYDNSKTKVDGYVQNIGIAHKYQNSSVQFNYLDNKVKRKNFITNTSLKTLEAQKYNLNYTYSINNNIHTKVSYIKIIDNLAPTDQGKVYGAGVNYNINKALGTEINFYRSDYKTFNVDQYDLSIYKMFKLNDIKLKAALNTSTIKIIGDKYGSFSFQDKDYFTTAVKLNGMYNNYVAGVAMLFGKRIFHVLDNGNKVQHHAMEQNKTYMLSFGKKFKNFDIVAKYSYQNGYEVPENQTNVKTEVASLMLNYKF